MTRIVFFLLIFIGSRSDAMSMDRFSSREKAYMSIGAGCLLGTGVGAYKAQDKANHQQAALAVNTLIGCASGALFSWLFHNDDQSLLVRQNDALTTRIEELERVIRTSNKGSPNPKYLDSLQLQENFSGDEALAKLIDPKCTYHRFYLGFEGRSLSNLYIPVDDGIVIKSLEYYVTRPKDPKDKSTVCVRDLKPYGYLSLELPGLGDILFNHAKSSLQKQKKEYVSWQN